MSGSVSVSIRARDSRMQSVASETESGEGGREEGEGISAIMKAER